MSVRRFEFRWPVLWTAFTFVTAPGMHSLTHVSHFLWLCPMVPRMSPALKMTSLVHIPQRSDLRQLDVMLPSWRPSISYESPQLCPAFTPNLGSHDGFS